MGRFLTEFESWLTGEMLVKDYDPTPMTFAEITRAGMSIHVMEDESGVIAVSTVMLPSFINVILGDTMWIKKDRRSDPSFLVDSIVHDLHRITGRELLIVQSLAPILRAKEKFGSLIPWPKDVVGDYSLSLEEMFLHVNHGAEIQNP